MSAYSTGAPQTGGDFVRVENLRFTYPGSGTGVNVSGLRITAPCMVAIVAPNGSGKSTLAKLLAGQLWEPYEGTVEVLGVEWRALRSDLHRQKHIRRIGYVPQDLGLPGTMAVYDALTRSLSDADVPRSEHRERIVPALRAVGLSVDDLSSRLIGSLSGGQQQRVAIARMLARRVQLVIADEPTAAVNPEAKAEFGDLLSSVVAEQGVPVLVVTHDDEMVSRCDEVYDLASEQAHKVVLPRREVSTSTPRLEIVVDRRPVEMPSAATVAALEHAAQIFSEASTSVARSAKWAPPDVLDAVSVSILSGANLVVGNSGYLAWNWMKALLTALLGDSEHPMFVLEPEAANEARGWVTGGPVVTTTTVRTGPGGERETVVETTSQPSLVPLDARLVIFESLEEMDPSALAVLKGTLGGEFGRDERFLNQRGRRVLLPNLLAAIAEIDRRYRASRNQLPYSQEFSYHFDIGVTLDDGGEAVQRGQWLAINGLPDSSDNALPGDGVERSEGETRRDATEFRIGPADAQAFRAAARQVRSPGMLAERTMTALERDYRRMGWALPGALARTMSVARAFAAARGDAWWNESDLHRSVQLRRDAWKLLEGEPIK